MCTRAIQSTHHCHYHGVDVLAHEAEEVDVLSDDLMVGLARHVVLLGPLLRVRLGRDERNVHVEVVGVLDTAHHLQ